MKSKTDFFTTILLMMVFFVGLITYIFDLSGWVFYVEFILILGLIFLGFISLVLIFNRINFGYTVSAIISALALVNLVIFYFKRSFSTILFASLIASIATFVISVVSIGEKEREPKPVTEKKDDVVLKTYTPGKVVSSKRAKYYHAPKCDWAKKIKKANQVWYDSDDEAKADGLKAHDCLE